LHRSSKNNTLVKDRHGGLMQQKKPKLTSNS